MFLRHTMMLVQSSDVSTGGVSTGDKVMMNIGVLLMLTLVTIDVLVTGYGCF